MSEKRVWLLKTCPTCGRGNGVLHDEAEQIKVFVRVCQYCGHELASNEEAVEIRVEENLS